MVQVATQQASNPVSKIYIGQLVRYLSNDPDNNYNYSIFYCSVAVRSTYVKVVMFSGEEFINRWKAGL